MPDQFEHLKEERVQEAERLSVEHIATCPQCQRAPGPQPPGGDPAVRDRYACEEGVRLHEAAVLAAHEAHRALRGR